MPPTTLPRVPGGLLDQLLSMCDERGWGRDGLELVHMSDIPPAPPPPAPDPDPEPPDPPDLGDAGKRALDAERQARADAEKARKTAEKKAKELEEQLAAATADQQTDHEKAIDAARKEADATARSEVQAELHRERVESALIRAAAGVLEDPQDAIVYLADKVEIGDDGRPDPKKVTAMVAKLAEQKPGLTVSGAKPPPGSFDGGARDGHDAPTQERVKSFVERMKSTA